MDDIPVIKTTTYLPLLTKVTRSNVTLFGQNNIDYNCKPINVACFKMTRTKVSFLFQYLHTQCSFSGKEILFFLSNVTKPKWRTC